jgi:hypothetical protein
MQFPRVAGSLQPLQQRAGQVLPPFRKGDQAHAEAQHQEGLRRETAQAHERVHEPDPTAFWYAWSTTDRHIVEKEKCRKCGRHESRFNHTSLWTHVSFDTCFPMETRSKSLTGSMAIFCVFFSEHDSATAALV